MLCKRTSYRLALLALCCLLLSGCASSMLKKNLGPNINEQLYIDARLDFAIKHPLDWQLKQVPVSSPQYRADTIRWQVKDLKQQNRGSGEMLIRSRLSNPKFDLQDLLSLYLSTEPELKSSQTEDFEHPSGPALKLLGHDDNQGRLTIALKGQKRDFIISLDCSSSRFEELLPVFQDIVSSFVEVVKPATATK
jgi:hypothetical protein